MDKILQAMRHVATQVVLDYQRAGGTVLDGAKALTADEVSSFDGALTPLMWMLAEFSRDYELPFPSIYYAASPQAMVGVAVSGLEVSGSASTSVFILSDFLRNEVFTTKSPTVDLSMLFANFQEWAYENVAGAPEPSAQRKEYRPS